MEESLTKLRIIVADARDRNPDMVLPFQIEKATYLQLHQAITEYMIYESKKATNEFVANKANVQ